MQITGIITRILPATQYTDKKGQLRQHQEFILENADGQQVFDNTSFRETRLAVGQKVSFFCQFWQAREYTDRNGNTRLYENKYISSDITILPN